MRRRLALLLVVFVPFVVFSVTVLAAEGFVGLFRLALRERWGLQMLLDLAIFYVLFALWVVRDARSRGLSPWPWVAATAILGSMGALAYLVFRELRAPRAAT